MATNRETVQTLVTADKTLTQYITYEKQLEGMERIISETKPWNDKYETITKEYLAKREEYNNWLNEETKEEE